MIATINRSGLIDHQCFVFSCSRSTLAFQINVDGYLIPMQNVHDIHPYLGIFIYYKRLESCSYVCLYSTFIYQVSDIIFYIYLLSIASHNWFELLSISQKKKFCSEYPRPFPSYDPSDEVADLGLYDVIYRY